MSIKFKSGLLALTLGIGIGMASTAHAADKIRVAIAQVYPSFSVAPYAKEKGIFTRNGLDVEITTYRGGGPAQEAVAAGAADAMTNGPHVAALAAQKGVKQKIIARCGTANPDGWVLITGKNSGINSVADLAGKKVGITGKGSHSDFLLQLALDTVKATATPVPLGGGIYNAVKAGQVDAGTVWPVLSFKSAEDPDLKIIYDFGKLSGLALDVWTFTDSYIASNPGAVHAFVKSLREALKQMKADRAGTIAFLKKYLDEQDDKVVNLAFDRMIMTIPDDLVADKKAAANTIAMAKLVGIETSVNIDELFTDKFTK